MFTNSLINEKSPYLKQHAHNPVNWMPWSDDAFKEAEREDKPVFLSIGYSTCHWCHVMAKESFENVDIARILNEYFVPVKVDREEMPEVDSIYMDFVINFTGRGGWPLSLFLTPERKPFFGATYIPPGDVDEKMGFKSILKLIAEKWDTERDNIISSANEILNELKKRNRTAVSGKKPNKVLIDNGFKGYYKIADPKYGGFGAEPKFPAPHNLEFILKYLFNTGNNNALHILNLSLERMSEGGINDHLAGGFHRYSTDKMWHLPHFEKMLYDQALISKLYLNAYAALNKDSFADVSEKTLDFVCSNMRSSEGGFFAAYDADSFTIDGSEKVEGAYYVWEKNEIFNILGSSDGELFCRFFSVGDNGNIGYDPHNIFSNKNVLHINKDLKNKIDSSHLKRIEKAKEVLLKARKKRPMPEIDNKILLDWNCLTVTSLCLAHRLLNRKKYLDKAIECNEFIESNLTGENGSLNHCCTDGLIKKTASIDDYAFYIESLFSLYYSTLDIEYLMKAVFFTDRMIELFSEDNSYKLLFSRKDSDIALYRQLKYFDGAIPSGYSTALINILKIYKLTLNQRYKERAEGMAEEIFSKVLLTDPTNYSQYLNALYNYFYCVNTLIIKGSHNSELFSEALKFVNKNYLPNLSVIILDTDNENCLKVLEIAPWLKSYLEKQGDYVFFCDENECRRPVSDVSEFKKLSQKLLNYI